MKTRKTLHNFVCWVGIWSLLSMFPIFGIIVTSMVVQNTANERDDFYIQPALLEKIQDYAVKAGWISIGSFLAAVLVVEKTAKAIRKAEIEAELRRTFNNHNRYQNRRVRRREFTQTHRVQQFPAPEATRPILGDLHESLFSARPVQPLACKGCKYYDGSSYGGNLLICGIHPYGPGDESEPSKQATSCQDWEDNKSPNSDFS